LNIVDVNPCWFCDYFRNFEEPFSLRFYEWLKSIKVRVFYNQWVILGWDKYHDEDSEYNFKSSFDFDSLFDTHDYYEFHNNVEISQEYLTIPAYSLQHRERIFERRRGSIYRIGSTEFKNLLYNQELQLSRELKVDALDYSSDETEAYFSWLSDQRL